MVSKTISNTSNIIPRFPGILDSIQLFYRDEFHEIPNRNSRTYTRLVTRGEIVLKLFSVFEREETGDKFRLKILANGRAIRAPVARSGEIHGTYIGEKGTPWILSRVSASLSAGGIR